MKNSRFFKSLCDCRGKIEDFGTAPVAPEVRHDGKKVRWAQTKNFPRWNIWRGKSGVIKRGSNCP